VVVYITRRIRFAASHYLKSPNLTEEENNACYGVCTNVHGHNYNLFVTLKGKADPKTGLLLHLTELDDIIETNLTSKVDHQSLNDVEELKDIIPSLENLIVRFWDLLNSKLPAGLLDEIKLEETENNSVIYRGETA
jgi:6-pyruvoyltetrahydropterin/6-carboxytetrahydropterin synthase